MNEWTLIIEIMNVWISQYTINEWTQIIEIINVWISQYTINEWMNPNRQIMNVWISPEQRMSAINVGKKQMNTQRVCCLYVSLSTLPSVIPEQIWIICACEENLWNLLNSYKNLALLNHHMTMHHLLLIQFIAVFPPKLMVSIRVALPVSDISYLLWRTASPAGVIFIMIEMFIHYRAIIVWRRQYIYGNGNSQYTFIT